MKIQNKPKTKGQLKMTKLTKTQEQLMENMLNANWYYMYEGKSIGTYTFINGERVTERVYTGCFIMGENRVSTEAKTTTIKAMEKKGVINIIKASENGGLDLVEIPNHKFPEPLKQMKQVVVRAFPTNYPDGNRTTFDLYTLPNGDTAQLIEAFFNTTGWEYEATLSEEIVDVTTWSL